MHENAGRAAEPRFVPRSPPPRRGWEGWARPHGSTSLLPPIPVASPARARPWPWRSGLRWTLLTARDLAIVLLLFLLLRATVEGFSVDGLSMQPTLHDRDRVLVNKISYQRVEPRFLGWVPVVGDSLSKERFLLGGPQRGDIVVFDDPRFQGDEIVKRVIGLPGETVELRGGSVFVDGRELEEPYVTAPSSDYRPPLLVPEETYYVLGDNRSASVDSRNLGPVPLAAIVGKLSLRYWPLRRLSLGPNLPFGLATPHVAKAPSQDGQPTR